MPAPSIEPAVLERGVQDYLDLHRQPELSMAEWHTAQFIEERLDQLGVEHFRCAGTGVIGLQRRGPGPVVAFRADIDGLPIQEETGLSYASTATARAADGATVPVMHGCGHDSHVASALTAARCLARPEREWAGTVVWIFQPGEESGAGARALLEDGLWQRAPRPELVLGQHIGSFAAGQIRLAHGPVCAQADSWLVRIQGRQAHAARPHTGLDPIVQACATIMRLQAVVAREVDALQSAAVTVGTFQAGLKENIIPERAEFSLNIRTFDPLVRQRLLAAVRRVIRAEATASGAPDPELIELANWPALHNDPAATTRLERAFAAGWGDRLSLDPPSMGSEDFGLLAQAIDAPSVFWRYGGLSESQAAAQAAGQDVPSNHSPSFAPDPARSLATGAQAALTSLLSRLAR